MAIPLSLVVTDQEVAAGDRLVIDDFSDPAASRLGTRWTGSSDWVMGGVSDGRLIYTTIADQRCMRLTGFVTESAMAASCKWRWI